jgi:hypothetical protein
MPIHDADDAINDPPTVEDYQSDVPILKALTLTYYCQRKADRVDAVLWPDGDDPTRRSNVDQLLAFLCELDPTWTIHDPGRRRLACQKHPDGYFHFTFDRERHRWNAEVKSTSPPNVHIVESRSPPIKTIRHFRGATNRGQ